MVFFATAALVIFSHIIMGLTKYEVIPNWGAIIALTGTQFGYSAGYNSVGNLLQGELLPADMRSVGVGLIATAEVLSSLSQTALVKPIEDAFGQGGLFLVFACVVLFLLLFSVGFMPETSALTLEQIENKWQNERQPECSIRRDPVLEYRRLSKVRILARRRRSTFSNAINLHTYTTHTTLYFLRYSLLFTSYI